MRTDGHHVARHVDRVPILPAPRTVFALVSTVLGLAGAGLFGIGLIEVWGGIWAAFGFVICVAITAVAGFDLVPSTPVRTAGMRRSAQGSPT